MFITYVVLDPRKPGSFASPFGTFEFRPAYIGKGRPSRPLDIVTFLEGTLDSYSGCLINSWLEGMKRLGYKELPVLTVYEGDEVTAFATERILTKHFGIIPEGGILFNARHGGNDGWSMSPETKLLLKELNSGKNNPNFGKKASKETLRRRAATWAAKENRSRSPESMKNTWASTARKYEVKTAEGGVFVVDDLTKFCNEKSLPLSTLRKNIGRTIVAKKRPSRIDGWSIRYLT